MIKNYIITGSSGFIAQALISKISRNKNNIIIGIDKKQQKKNNFKNFFFIKNDLGSFDKNLLKKIQKYKKPNLKIEFWHLAANSDISMGVENQDVDYKNTFLTTLNSLKYSKVLNVEKFVFSSTGAVYGDNEKKLNETLFTNPISNYGAYKLASESIICAANSSTNTKYYIFRFANVIGPNVTHGIIYDFFQKIKKNKNTLNVLGDGNQTKPYIYIDDLISAINFVLKKENKKLNLYLIGPDNNNISVKEIVKIFCNLAAPKIKVNFQNKKRGWVGDVIKYRYDIRKIKTLGWKPHYTSKVSVIKTIKSFLK